MDRPLRVVLVSAAVVAALAGPAWAQAPAKPVATASTNWSGVSIDLMSVERKGSILTVKWALRNGGTGLAKPEFGLVGKHQTTYLVDEDSGTKYYVLTDKEKHALASEHQYIGSDTFGITDDLAPGATARYWAKFPAPPPQVKTISVFFTNSEPFESVPIAEK